MTPSPSNSLGTSPARLARFLLAIIACVACAALSAYGTALGALRDLADGGGKGGNRSLHIVAATELKPLRSALDKAAKELNVDLAVTYPDGTLANSHALACSDLDGTLDATCFATNRYAHVFGAGTKFRSEDSIAASPVALGVHTPVARENG